MTNFLPIIYQFTIMTDDIGNSLRPFEFNNLAQTLGMQPALLRNIYQALTVTQKLFEDPALSLSQLPAAYQGEAIQSLTAVVDAEIAVIFAEGGSQEDKLGKVEVLLESIDQVFAFSTVVRHFLAMRLPANRNYRPDGDA